MKRIYQATGKRKTSVSQIVLQNKVKVKSQVTIDVVHGNQPVSLNSFFPTSILAKKVLKPFVLTKTLGDFDVQIKVRGGGIASQADASCYAIAKALVKVSTDYVHPLKSSKLLTRDARIKERKKYGLKKARKAPQFSKR